MKTPSSRRCHIARTQPGQRLLLQRAGRWLVPRGAVRSQPLAMASLTVRPGGSYPEASCNADRTARLPWHWWIWLRFLAGTCVILRDFAGLESPKRICGPLPDQTRIRPCFWNESDPGVPSDSPPKQAKLTSKRKLLESLPKPLIFNILSYKKMDAGFILTPLPE